MIERVASAPERHRWLLVGAVGDRHDHERGMRASIDLLGRGKWSLGVAATFMHQGDGDRGAPTGFGDGEDGRDGKGRVVVYVARTRQIGRLFLRGQVGLGFGGTHDRDDDRDPVVARTTGESPGADGDRDHRGGPVAEASLIVGLPLGKHLGIVAGPVISAQHSDRDHGRHGRHGKEHEHDIAMFAGLMWRR